MVLRALLSDNTKVWIRSVLAKLGVEVGAYSGSVAQHRSQLINDGKVSTVWDVGAHVGQYGARLLSHGYRGHIVSVEPDARSFTELSRRASRRSGWTAVEVAISDVTGPATLNLSANGQSSSLFNIKHLHVAADPKSKYVGSRIVDCTTLDRLQANLVMMPPFFVKLDLQGGELAALRGAIGVLGATSACEVELSFAELYDDQGSWEEVVAFLAAAGFALCDVERVFIDPTSGDLLQVNVLLRRRG